MSMEIGFEDFSKLDLRIGKIIEVKEHPKADKLFVLKVSFGSEIGERKIVAGLRGYYSVVELVGKKGVFIVNLEPRILRGVESQGMILAASDSDGKARILVADGDLEEGSKIS